MKIFYLRLPKKIVVEPFCVSKKIWYRKISCIIGSMTVFKSFCVRGPKQKSSWETVLHIRNFLVWKKFMYKRKIYFLVWNVMIFRPEFFPHAAEKLPQRTFLCFRVILLRNKSLGIGGVAYHDFLAEIFCLTVRIKFVWEPICVSKKTWCRNLCA